MLPVNFKGAVLTRCIVGRLCATRELCEQLLSLGLVQLAGKDALRHVLVLLELVEVGEGARPVRIELDLRRITLGPLIDQFPGRRRLYVRTDARRHSRGRAQLAQSVIERNMNVSGNELVMESIRTQN